MKKSIAIILSLILMLGLMSACTTAPASSSEAPATEATPEPDAALSGTVKTGGSTSVEKVMTALIYQFQDINREVTINYEMNGSGDGIKNTISGMYEIGHSSRELKTDGSEDGLTAMPYAIDGIAVIVHPDNPVSNLTAEQIKGIYTGAITNWSEVGGNDELITVVTREASSGTRGAIAELIGLEVEDDPTTAIVAEATTCDSTGAVQTTVSQNSAAIGYMSFSDVDPTAVKAVQFEGVDISEASLKDSTYTLKREFYLLTAEGTELTPAAQAFVDFVLGAEGQQIVADNVLLPIN